MAVGTIGSDSSVLVAFTAHIFPIIRVKIQQHAAGAQNPVPFFVGLFRIRKGPCQIPADYHVKAIILITEVLCIHLPKYNIKMPFCSEVCRFFQHCRCDINPLHAMALLRQENRKESGACSNVQNFQRFFFRQLAQDFLAPSDAHLIFQFIFANDSKIVGSPRPVILHAFFYHSDTTFLRSLFVRYTIGDHGFVPLNAQRRGLI